MEKDSKHVVIRAYPDSMFAFKFRKVPTEEMLERPKSYYLEAHCIAQNRQELENGREVLIQTGLYDYSYELVQTGEETQYTQNLEEALEFLE